MRRETHVGSCQVPVNIISTLLGRVTRFLCKQLHHKHLQCLTATGLRLSRFIPARRASRNTRGSFIEFAAICLLKKTRNGKPHGIHFANSESKPIWGQKQTQLWTTAACLWMTVTYL